MAPFSSLIDGYAGESDVKIALLGQFGYPLCLFLFAQFAEIRTAVVSHKILDRLNELEQENERAESEPGEYDEVEDRVGEMQGLCQS